jgi:hypothetical protein
MQLLIGNQGSSITWEAKIYRAVNTLPNHAHASDILLNVTASILCTCMCKG